MYYIVTYQEVVVGLYHKDKTNTTFEINTRGVEELVKMGYSLPYPIASGNLEGKIALFENRIKNASRFPGIDYSNNFMDAWRLYSINVREE